MAGVCYVYAMDRVITDKSILVSGSPTAAFAAGTRVHVETIAPGAMGTPSPSRPPGPASPSPTPHAARVGGLGGRTGTTCQRMSLGGF